MARILYTTGYGGNYPGDIGQDTVVIEAAKAHGHSYMMGLSTLQYKDSYGTNVYRGGGENLPLQMSFILGMKPAPDYIQIITWVSDFSSLTAYLNMCLLLTISRMISPSHKVLVSRIREVSGLQLLTVGCRQHMARAEYRF